MGVNQQRSSPCTVTSKPLRHTLQNGLTHGQEENTMTFSLSSIDMPQIIDEPGTIGSSLGLTSSLSGSQMTSQFQVATASPSLSSKVHQHATYYTVGLSADQQSLLLDSQIFPHMNGHLSSAIPQFDDILDEQATSDEDESVDKLKTQLEVYEKKLERRREQNRRAARRSRQKKRDKGQDIIKITQKLSSENAELQMEIVQLRTQRSFLLEYLDRHMTTCSLVSGTSQTPEFTTRTQGCEEVSETLLSCRARLHR